MNIIAISGKAGSGKTTAAKIIESQFQNYYLASIATPIKSMVATEFGDIVSLEDLYGNKDKIISLGGRKVSVRTLLIEFGRMYRQLDEDFWIRKMLKDVDSDSSGKEGIVIDDMRYANEVRILLSRGAHLIRIERPGVSLIDDISETGLDDFPFEETIHNEKDIDEFVRCVSRVARRLIKP